MAGGAAAAPEIAWRVRAVRLRFLLRLSIAMAMVLPFLSHSLASPVPASAQVAQGATMTVLRGEVGVIRPDGSAVQPAPSGTLVSVGDEIRTLTRSGALITFFVGTEIELGEDTVLVVEAISREGDQVDVSLKQVFGAALHRVARFSDPGSSYRVNAGGAVTLVRGTEFLLLGPTPEGIVVILCLQDCDQRSTFVGCMLAPYTGYYVVVEQNQIVEPCQSFAPNRDAGYWEGASEAASDAQKERGEDEPPPEEEDEEEEDGGDGGSESPF